MIRDRAGGVASHEPSYGAGQAVLPELLEAEMTEALGAEKGERTPTRLDYRWLPTARDPSLDQLYGALDVLARARRCARGDFLT